MVLAIMKKQFLISYIFLLMAAPQTLFAQDAAKTGGIETSQNGKNAECLGLAETRPDKAIDYAIDWRARFGGLAAEHCLAIAYINSDKYEEGADKLMLIANAADTFDTQFKAKTFSKAANAYLLADMSDKALIAINSSLAIEGENPNYLIDRARVYAMLAKWSDAKIDLTNAMKKGGEIGIALRLRAESQMQLGENDAAQKDIERAIELEPKEVDNYIVRGRIREAIRLGHPPV